MPESEIVNDKHLNVQISRTAALRLKKLFPHVVYSEAIEWLLSRYAEGLSDHASCANTELWIKLDRLEEVLSLLSLTNVDVGDIYRRQVGSELLRLRTISGHLASVAKAHSTGGKS